MLARVLSPLPVIEKLEYEKTTVYKSQVCTRSANNREAGKDASLMKSCFLIPSYRKRLSL